MPRIHGKALITLELEVEVGFDHETCTTAPPEVDNMEIERVVLCDQPRLVHNPETKKLDLHLHTVILNSEESLSSILLAQCAETLIDQALNDS